MNTYKVTVSYQGTRYKGFQYQPQVDTIEKRLKEALFTLFQSQVRFVSAGRTDTGVHACGQVFSFKSLKFFEVEALRKGLNRYLPDDIIVTDVIQVDTSFQARKSAVTREYQYLFSDRFIPFYLKEIVTIVKFQPNLERLNGIEKILVGENDFVNFRKMGSNEKTTLRTILSFKFTDFEIADIYMPQKQYKIYCFKIVGTSFLYSMVRNIVGALFEVLRGKVSVVDFQNMVQTNSKYQYTMAPAKGLCLVNVTY